MRNGSRGDILDAVENWLSLARAKDALQRAIIRNQAPCLVQYLFRRRLETSGVIANATSPKAGSFHNPISILRTLMLGSSRLIGNRADRGSPPAASDLLILSFQSNSTRALIPVATQLRSAGLLPHFLVDPDDAHSHALLQNTELSHTSLPPLHAPSSLRLAIVAYARSSTNLLDRRAMGQLLEAVHLERTTAEEHALRVQLRRELIQGSMRGAAIYSGLTKVKVPGGVLFSTHRALLDELLTTLAPDARRFLLLQGIVPAQPRISTHLRVQAAIAGSEIDRPYLEDCGIPSSRIFLTGYPDYDRFVGLDTIACRKKISLRHPGIGRRQIAVFTSQYATALFPEEARLHQLQVILVCAEQSPETFWIVKLHPRRERWLPKNLPSNLAIEKNTDTFELLAGADVVVTFWSTTALEALLVGTPLVQLNATGLPDLFDITNRIPRPTTRNAEDLLHSIQQALSEEGRAAQNATRRSLLLNQDGRAAERAAEVLIAELLRSKS